MIGTVNVCEGYKALCEVVSEIVQYFGNQGLREISYSLCTVSDVVQDHAEGCSQSQLLKCLVMHNDPDYEPCIVALSRISAAKPLSKDVEKIVSSYNLTK